MHILCLHHLLYCSHIFFSNNLMHRYVYQLFHLLRPIIYTLIWYPRFLSKRNLKRGTDFLCSTSIFLRISEKLQAWMPSKKEKVKLQEIFSSFIRLTFGNIWKRSHTSFILGKYFQHCGTYSTNRYFNNHSAHIFLMPEYSFLNSIDSFSNVNKLLPNYFFASPFVCCITQQITYRNIQLPSHNFSYDNNNLPNGK